MNNARITRFALNQFYENNTKRHNNTITFWPVLWRMGQNYCMIYSKNASEIKAESSESHCLDLIWDMYSISAYILYIFKCESYHVFIGIVIYCILCVVPISITVTCSHACFWSEKIRWSFFLSFFLKSILENLLFRIVIVFLNLLF